MKEILRTSLWCLFMALALNVAFSHAQALVPQTATAADLPWLKVFVRNPTGSSKPEDVTIISANKPEVRKLRDNRWQISFWP